MTTELSTVRPSGWTEIPTAWVDRLFQRFDTMYGRHWRDMWADTPMADVKDAWQSALAGCTGDQIAAGLRACGTFPPTMPEFVALCRQPRVAAHQDFPRLSAPRSQIPPHIAEQLREFIAKHKVSA